MKIDTGSLEIGGLHITFHRTLRLPEDGKTHALPPSLGRFPLRRVDDFKDKVPPAWREHGGIFLPLYQREALWLGFGAGPKPSALKVAAGKVNAVSGTPWSETLAKLADKKNADDPDQDYMVVPGQPWLDGFNVGGGVIRQFIAMPLGMKYTVEAQITGEEKFGGIQFLAFAPKPGGKADRELVTRTSAYKGGGASGQSLDMNLESYSPPGAYLGEEIGIYASDMEVMRSASPTRHSLGGERRRTKSAEMGLAQGGKMKQKIYVDTYGVDAWDPSNTERCFVHIVNSELWREITGEAAPETPVSAQEYTKHGLPWFDLYDEGVPAVAGSTTLAGLTTVAGLDQKHGFDGQQDDSPISESNVVKYDVTDKSAVRDGTW